MQYDWVDPFNSARRSYYGITSMPVVCGDGTSDIWPSLLPTCQPQHASVPSPLMMSVSENAVGSFTATITAEQDVPNAVFVMVAVEDDYVDAYGGNTSHLPYHARTFLTGVTGDPFSITAGETVHITKSFTVDPSWDYGKMGVACWVQRPGGTNPTTTDDIPVFNEVLQAAFVATGETGIEDGASAHRVALAAPSPNPFSELSRLSFTLPERKAVRLAIYDVSGRLVRTLVDDELAAGAHHMTWDGRSGEGSRCGSGIYFARLNTVDGTAASRKLVRVK